MIDRTMKHVCRDLAAAIARYAQSNGLGEVMPKSICGVYTRRVRASQVGWIMGRQAWVDHLNSVLAEHGLAVERYDRTRRPPTFHITTADPASARRAKADAAFHDTAL